MRDGLIETGLMSKIHLISFDLCLRSLIQMGIRHANTAEDKIFFEDLKKRKKIIIKFSYKQKVIFIFLFKAFCIKNKIHPCPLIF